MDIKVILRNVRIAPRKSRQVIDLVRNKNVAEARALLEFTVKRAADPVLKLLNSAVASAVNDFKLDEKNLYISKITADAGPTLKRSNPESRGRAFPIMKRTSHIALIVSELKPTQPKKEAKKEVVEKKEESKAPKKQVKKTVKKSSK
jgi:large subunit ribosomal protein L22